MSPKHPPKIDLDALQDKLDDLAHQPLAHPTALSDNGDAAALAIENAVSVDGHAGPGNGGAESALAPEPPVSVPVPRLGVEAAANMTKLSKAAAHDIRQLGQLAFDAGKRVQEECEQMALDVEANGGTIALHLTGLSQLLADVGMSNRETLHRLLGGVPPSIVPAPGNGQLPEQPVGAASVIRAALLGKNGSAA
jgi:hypothetical protein